MSSLLDKVNAPSARRWEFTEGDLLIGEVTGLGSYTGEYGTSRTVTVYPSKETTEDGKAVSAEPLIFFASSSVAAQELDQADPQVGDEIAIKYHGEKPTKTGGNTYKLFRIAVEHTNKLAKAVEETGGGW